MRKKVIEFVDFSFQYESQSEATLKNINLSIYEGEKILIVGASGSGKSTLVHCLNGLIPHLYKGKMTGSAKIGGKDLESQSLHELSFQTGTVLQDTDGQFIGLTVGEDIAFALENDEVSQEVMLPEVEKWAEKVEISTHLTHKPQELSGGQKQRVSMAGVLISESPILLFDEPLANLDPHAGKETIELIDELHKQTNTTVIIVEHRLEDVLHRNVDRIIVVNEGEIVSDTSPDELLKSETLMTYGIREPLYVTAMKYAEIDVKNVENLADLRYLKGKEIKQKLENWQGKHPNLVTKEASEELLSLERVNYRYQNSQKKVLNDISFQIQKGERISIVGKNGSGKSTLSKVICGFLQANGTFLWQKKEIREHSIKERAEKIGYVMQNPNQMISKTMIFDEVALGLKLRGVEEEEIKERVEKTLKVCGLYSFRNWPISALSYGQKKRVTIAAILVLEPEMIILDEPTAGQDFRNYSEMMNFLDELNAQGKTIVMITHDMHLMLEYSDRTFAMLDGEILADKLPSEVLTDEQLVKKANLKETSLFTLAKTFELEKPELFVQKFIAYDRVVRENE
ncbi:energy-coupling factor transport system ATP-binding protein [Pilibacter termitis]|uniref:Energy-coupling factor transport system ATP-binding protein n=1 Tax=Pilibacter termitis TaxID=263852 RepID=A0A1T4KI91_9ENTE|nr:ABC transporter ATP-binding protein [Pilibacter termitis]SJZ42139.1 energy-coupling factor transport system ATP-binding protein [Pilibacter termitis]